MFVQGSSSFGCDVEVWADICPNPRQWVSRHFTTCALSYKTFCILKCTCMYKYHFAILTMLLLFWVLGLSFKLLVSHLQQLCTNLESHAEHSWVYTPTVQFTLMRSTLCLLIWHYTSCTWKLVQLNHHWRYTGLWSFSFNVLRKWGSNACLFYVVTS